MYGAAELNVPKVVAVLGYMNLMRLPMALTPKMLGAFVDSLVSYGRLGTFLFKGDEIVERKKFPRIKKNQKYIVQVKKTVHLLGSTTLQLHLLHRLHLLHLLQQKSQKLKLQLNWRKHQNSKLHYIQRPKKCLVKLKTATTTISNGN